jgi:GNAT superfamily N-acetyltransferase
MRIRRARPDDFLKVQSLLTQLMPGLPRGQEAMWDALGDYPGSGAWVAAIDDALAGFLDLFLFPDVAHGARIAIINNLIVGEPFRRRGLGTRLLHAAVDHSSREQAIEVHVWTDFDNAPAIQLYKSVGFAERALLLELDTSRLHDSAPRK